MSGQNIILGTLILSVSSILVRMLGFFFRIYLSNAMGAEGMGVYTLIMSLYMLCATLATAGISAAVSKLAAEQLAFGNPANGRLILRRAVLLSLLPSLLVGGLLFTFADWTAAYVLKDVRTALSLKLLAPGLPLMSLASCLRGYFIAQREVANPAIGQVAEQLFKMTFIILLLRYCLPLGLEYGCALVVLGITLGELVCFGYSFAGYLRHKRKNRPCAGGAMPGLTGSILWFALPVSISSNVRSALRLAEDVLILSSLKQYTGQEAAATGTYGMLKGMVMPLLTFPLSLLSAFVVTLTPEISRLSAAGERVKLNRTISKILQYTLVIGMLIVCLFLTFGRELGNVLYHDPEVGNMLQALAVLCPFMCVEMVVVAILQGLGEQIRSTWYSVTDSILRIGLIYLLVPATGIPGFLWMVVASNLYTCILNLRRLKKVTALSLQWNDWVIKPALAVLATGQGVRALYQYALCGALPDSVGVLAGMTLMAAAYTLVVWSLGCVSSKDASWILTRLRLSKKTPETALESTL